MGIFAINLFSSKKDAIQNIGGSFLLKDHEEVILTQEVLKKLIYFDIPTVQIYVHDV